jgi:hypothetical protein
VKKDKGERRKVKGKRLKAELPLSKGGWGDVKKEKGSREKVEGDRYQVSGFRSQDLTSFPDSAIPFVIPDEATERS